mmetsp:Transcript_6056/g.12152  ORF Transcript_6056/g.12152 Transcript_6056/m.12152 type:complete len:370 (-) Transcript_6056:162-1271(-)
MIFLHEGVQIGPAVVLRRAGGFNILAAKLAIDEVFLAHDLLGPHDDIVHVRGGDTCHFGNTARDAEPAGDIFGKVAVAEVGFVLFDAVDFDLDGRVSEATVPLVALEHGINIGLVTNIVAVRPKHPFSDMMKTTQVKGGILFHQDALEFKDFVGHQCQLLTRVFIGTLVKERRLIHRHINISVAVVSVADRRVPYRVNVHEGDGQKVAGGDHLGGRSDDGLQRVESRINRGSQGRRNDNVYLFFGTKDFDTLTVFNNTACPRESLECKETRRIDKLVAENVTSAHVEATFTRHGTQDDALFQERLQFIQIEFMSETREGEDHHIGFSRNGRIIGTHARLSKAIRTKVIHASDALARNVGRKTFGFTGKE